MASGPNDMHENATSSTNTCDVQPQPVEVTDDKNKTPRHPRWTRQETLVLIEGKKFAENRGRKGRRSSSIFGTDQLEPKWDAVSSHCRQHGANRGPVQCRKRWSNLVCDFKKIKAWESQVKEESESFWIMRNDLRKENKLPCFFDREIYDVLDGKAYKAAAYQLALVTISADRKDNGQLEALEGQDEDVEEETADAQTVSDSGLHAKMEDGLFPDFEQSAHEEGAKSPVQEQVPTDSSTKRIPAPVPISERQYQPFQQACLHQANGKQPTDSHFWRESAFQEGLKRRRMSLDGCQDYCLEHQLIKVLERNSKAMNAQLESQNLNSNLDREQRKDHNDSLVAALSKISEALAKIADKL